MESEWKLNLIVEAFTRGILDYSKYDGTSEWNKRENLVLMELARQRNVSALDQICRFNQSLLVAGLQPTSMSNSEFIEHVTKIHNDLLKELIPWSSKSSTAAISSESDKLIEYYKQASQQLANT